MPKRPKNRFSCCVPKQKWLKIMFAIAFKNPNFRAHYVCGNNGISYATICNLMKQL